MDIEVLKAADKLKEGKLSDTVIETSNGYYVIRMDSTDDKEAAKTKKESILTQRRNDKYSETVESYKESSDWKINENEWKKVNFDELYTAKAEETTTSTDDTSGTGTDDTSNADGTGTDDTSDTGSTGTDDTSNADSTDAEDTSNAENSEE